jgi:transcriptional regulator with XRE-family HTH domain
MARVNDRIREARRVSGLTEEALAERIGVPPATLHELENGADVSERHVKRIAVATGVPVAFFRDGETPETQDGGGARLRARVRAALDWLAAPSGPDGAAGLLADLTERERAVEERERRLAERERALEVRSQHHEDSDH